MIRFVFFFFVMLLFACKPAQKEVCDDPILTKPQIVLDEMVGTWENQDGIHFERWRKVDSTHYLSDVYRIEKKDTILLELAKIYFSEKKWNFENWVKNQNSNQTVVFKADIWDDKEIAFKNPAHDFPSEIHYKMVSDTVLNAFIVGKNELGKSDTIQFNYRRLN